MSLGSLLWWGIADVQVPHPELRAALRAAGFAVPLPLPSTTVVEQRAVRAWTARQERRIRPSTLIPEEELAPLRAVYRELHLAIDLSRLIRRLVEHIPGAVQVRVEGGLVFAPPEAHAELLRLRTLIRDLPLAPESAAPAAHLIAVADTPETRADLAEAVMAGLLQELNALNRGVDRLQANDRVVRPDTINDRQIQVRTVAERAHTHAGLLTAAQQETLAAAVEGLEQRLVRLAKR
jgi:hypothetical protein